MKVIIVGGVAGGASCAARLRRLDEHAEIIIYERGAYISYANCGLPYYIGGEITNKNDLTLQTPQSFYARFRIIVKTGHEVLRVDAQKKCVVVKNLATGEEFCDSYDKLVLSPGAKPILPKINNLNDPRIFTLRNIPDTEAIFNFIAKKQPKTAVIVGGGYIGVEMAENLMVRGIAVTVVEMANHLINSIDEDIACDVQNFLRAKGLKIILQNGVKEIVGSKEQLTVRLQNGEVCADMVLLSIGVRPDTEFLEGSGLARTVRGALVVSDTMQTSSPDIYAVGDAVQITDFVTGAAGYIPLAGPANKQGRIVANNIAGIADTYKKTQGSSVLKLFEMTVATTGISEKTAKALGYAYKKVILWAASHATYYPGANNMSIKLLFLEGTGALLGAQIAGKEGVDKRIDVLSTALRAGFTVHDLTSLELAYAPPFSSAKDPVNLVGFMAENVLAGLVKQFYVEDIPALSGREDIIRLDVRTEAEVSRGVIEGTNKFIPVDCLRQHLAELDKTKAIYVNCQSGLRSYIACRILQEEGYNCFNLAGGYRLYSSMKNSEGLLFDVATHPCGIQKGL